MEQGLDRGFKALFLSLCLHLVLSLLIALFAPKTEPKRQPIEIVVLPTTTNLKSQNESTLVRESFLPDRLKVKESNDPLRFWSKERVRVKEQTQAAISGKTQNSFENSKQENLKTKSASKQTLLKNTDSYRDEGLAQTKSSSNSPLQEMLNSRSRANPSTIGESLPQEVKVGAFTALNTDRHLFYSFYARVEEKIRDTWEDGVINTLRRTPREKLEANVQFKWVTSLEVLVKPNGKLHKILLMKESGLKSLDQAAAQAFIKADYFPNPPHEMVQEDGFIHMNYSFTVNADPKAMAGY